MDILLWAISGLLLGFSSVFCFLYGFNLGVQSEKRYESGKSGWVSYKPKDEYKATYDGEEDAN